jgi:thiosulfate/3-mercaptopyruvate sulfurtransferase
MDCMYTALITPNELRALQSHSAPLQLFDCSFELANPAAGEAQFNEAHIPGALHAHLDHHLSSHSADDRASGGRHPLPSRETLAAWLDRIGLTADTQAVVYDRQGANYSGRLWWMLKWCGHEAVAVLDGGLQAWLASGGAAETGPATPRSPGAPGGFVLRDPLVRLVDTATIASRLGDPALTLVDARAAARFRGEVEPLDPVAGHIPGALNRPFVDNIGADGCFKPAAQLRAEFEQLLAGRAPSTVIHHCGSGVSAIPNLLGMEVAGLGRSALYAGSWSEWCNTPGLPCAQSQVAPTATDTPRG